MVIGLALEAVDSRRYQAAALFIKNQTLQHEVTIGGSAGVEVMWVSSKSDKPERGE